MISMFIIRYSPCPLSACNNKLKSMSSETVKVGSCKKNQREHQREGTNGMIQQDSLGIMATMRSTAVIIDSEVK